MAEAAPTISFPALNCPATILPTKKDLFEALDGAASFPARLKAYAETLVGAEAQKWIDQAEQIDELLDGIRTILSQWDPKNNHPYIPGKEWEKIISRIREDYNMFVQKSILEIMAAIIPIEFTVPILGMQIDLIALVTDPSSIKESIKADVDKLYALLPAEFQDFKGEFGLESDEYKIEQVFAYIKSLANKAMNGIMTAGFTSLIDIFSEIWSLLDLPEFVPGEIPDIEAMVKAVVDEQKANYASAIAALGDNPGQAAKDALKDELNLGVIDGIENLELFGFKILDLIGGTWDEAVDCAEFKINRLKEEMNEFKENWYAYLMKKWMEIVMKFLEMIGLGALMEWVTFTFCDFLTLIAFPKVLDLAFAEGITQVASSGSGSLTSASNSAGVVAAEITLSASDSTGYFKYTATAGQTEFAGVDENGNILEYDVTGIPGFLLADVLIMRRIAGVALEIDVNPIEITDYSTNAEGDTITLDDPVTIGDTITIVDLNGI